MKHRLAWVAVAVATAMATVENVRTVLEAINTRSTIRSDMVKKGELRVVGATYDLDTGW